MFGGERSPPRNGRMTVRFANENDRGVGVDHLPEVVRVPVLKDETWFHLGPIVEIRNDFSHLVRKVVQERRRSR